MATSRDSSCRVPSAFGLSEFESCRPIVASVGFSASGIMNVIGDG